MNLRQQKVFSVLTDLYTGRTSKAKKGAVTDELTECIEQKMEEKLILRRSNFQYRGSFERFN